MDVSNAIDIHPYDFYELTLAIDLSNPPAISHEVIFNEEYFQIDDKVYHRTNLAPKKTKNIGLVLEPKNPI